MFEYVEHKINIELVKKDKYEKSNVDIIGKYIEVVYSILYLIYQL
ncbi:hypothetical protein YN1_8340 [Nanoarchaeota archaeon]